MDANPFENEKLSIKNLLFTKAIPNYKLPVATDGRLIYACTDCGDKFIIKSSYEYHIKRKSLKITYYCRHCNITKIFFNRCDLLSHIRSHVFKTATISISNLKIEPLPLAYYNYQSQNDRGPEGSQLLSCLAIQDDSGQNENQTIMCFDCKENIYSSGIIYKDRAKHYTQYNKMYSCPICLLTLTTHCALAAHLRIHKREPPYYCPDCGMFLTKKLILYPYSHHCESFKMMRATAKLRCIVNSCKKIFHPSEHLTHLKNDHLKSVFKCPICSVACYKLNNLEKHLKSLHAENSKYIVDCKKLKHIEFLQCEMCPGRLVVPSQIDRHLKGHAANYPVYPCWTCGEYFIFAKTLLKHQELKHPDIFKEKIHGTNTHGINMANALCNMSANSTPKIRCSLCKSIITQDWNIIKKHFAVYHKEHVCVDAKVMLTKICLKKYKRKINILKKKKLIKKVSSVSNISENNHNTFSETVSLEDSKLVCTKCGQGYESKENLEKHLIGHRDPFMAYQCMECGESFIAKRSFSTHLLVKHGINNVNEYIDEKKCYNEESLYLQKPIIEEQNEPVKENQCNICREQFDNPTDFEKHFRVHGMAFLMKSTNKPISPEIV